jgi:Cdc6-like AAA superfamily ATPase
MPYTHEEMHTILLARLTGTGVFQQRALEMAARKATAVTGDLRTALSICTRAVQIRRDQFPNSSSEQQQALIYRGS